MKKLTLGLDTFVVDTFYTTPEGLAWGTVVGNQEEQETPPPNTIFPPTCNCTNPVATCVWTACDCADPPAGDEGSDDSPDDPGEVDNG